MAGVGLVLALVLTVPPLSSTRIQTWPWAGAAALFWLLPLLVAVTRLALGRPDARLGGPLDLAFGAFAVTGVVSMLCSPLRATLAPHLLPYLGALSLPYALLPLFRAGHADRLAAAFIHPMIFATGMLWWMEIPSIAGPYPRNSHPFGHANTTGAVCALSACWLTWLALRANTRSGRLAHIAGALAAAALAASSYSRGAVLALAMGGCVAGAIFLLRRGRPLLLIGLVLLLAGAAIGSNERLRERVLAGRWSPDASESNDQRMAMLLGGFALAEQRPWTGWGPGAVPHVFPRVRAGLPGEPDNYLQLHNGIAQTAATLGVPGCLAIAALVLALLAGSRKSLRATAEQPRQTQSIALVATIACGLTLLLFDHSFATPAFAVLAALPVAALARGHQGERREAMDEGRSSSASLALRLSPLALCLPLGLPVGRDLAARAAWDAALDAAATNHPETFEARLREAASRAPADPFYADQLASHLATGHPFPGLRPPDPAAAVAVLEAVAARDPGHEFARYNLGWLGLEHAPDGAAARAEFAAAARLAPARGGVYLGLALACILDSDTSSAVRALAAETLLDPTFAWSPRWREPALAPLRETALAHAANALSARGLAPELAARLLTPGEPVDATGAFRRVRPGHGVLHGHPDGPPPADLPVFLILALPDDLRAALPPKGFLPDMFLLDCAGLAP